LSTGVMRAHALITKGDSIGAGFIPAQMAVLAETRAAIFLPAHV
jgi:hypothetical protein